MAYVLQIQDSVPPIYVGMASGFIVKVDSLSQATQFNRIGDANGWAAQLHDSVNPVSIP